MDNDARHTHSHAGDAPGPQQGPNPDATNGPKPAATGPRGLRRAVLLAALLLGARFTVDTRNDARVSSDEVVVDVVELRADSAAVGRSQRELQLGDPDAVVLAVVSDTTPELIEAEELDRAQAGGRVVVADWRADWIGLGVAEMLAANGCAVRLCVNGETAGQSIQSYVRHQWAGRLHRLGVSVEPYMRLYGADADTVYMQHVMTGDAVLMEDTDTLVLAYGHSGVIDLYEDLEGEVDELYAVGDCLSPRTAEEAVLEGLKVGTKI